MNKIWKYNNTLYRDSWEEAIDEECEVLFKESAAKEWSYLKSKYDSASDVTIEHLIKIFYFRDFSIYTRGWINSCYKYYHKVPIVKATNKPPRKEQLYEYLWGNKEDSFEGWHKAVVDDLNIEAEDLPKINKICSYEVYNFCQDYMMWVAYKISNNEPLELNDAFMAIEDLLEKYPLPDGVVGV